MDARAFPRSWRGPQISNADKPSTWICKRRGVTVLRQRFAIFGRIALVQPAQRRRGNPVAQLDNVHSVLRLNYKTLRGLISLASPSVAKLTLSETSRDFSS